jgi:hypothetical protein
MKKVGFLIFCLFAMCSMAGKAQDVVADSTGYIVKVGEMAPDFTVKLTDGKSITLSELRGKVVMLQFTASWCGVCRKEMPFIEKDIWLKHKSNPDFMLIGIDRDEPLEKVIAFGKSTFVALTNVCLIINKLQTNNRGIGNGLETTCLHHFA